MWTTPRGNSLVADIIEKQYQQQARAFFGKKMLRLLLERIRDSKPMLLPDNPDREGDKSSCKENNGKWVSGHREILKLHICACCRKKFYSNDRRRKYCD